MKNNEIKNEIDKIKKWEEKIKREDLKHEGLLLKVFILVKSI